MVLLYRFSKNLDRVSQCSGTYSFLRKGPLGGHLKAKSSGPKPVVNMHALIDKLVRRGSISATFPSSMFGEREIFNRYSPIVYAGFDATAPSLHTGHLPLLCALMHMYISGCEVIFVIGAATALLGDPSGHTRTRTVISQGRDLVRHFYPDADPIGLFGPIITSADGQKLSKSTGNAIWLDSNLSSPYQLYQHFRRTPDSELEKLLKLNTFFSLAEINHILTEHSRAPEKWMAQEKLASQICLLAHGQDGLLEAVNCTKALYQRKVLEELSWDVAKQLVKSLPHKELAYSPKMTVLELVMHTDFLANQKEALGQFVKGAVYVNHEKVFEPKTVLVSGVHILSNGITLVQIGKRNHFIFTWNNDQEFFAHDDNDEF